MKREEHFIVTEDALELADYLRLAADPACGAVATFSGTVRSPNRGEDVLYIDYEGYPAMIHAQMRALALELRAASELGTLVFAHRLGRLHPGEASIVIVVAAPHRREALAACERAIDRSKELLPVWKREASASGERWVAGSSAAGTPLD